MASYFEQQAEQKKEMRRLVETITLGHQNVREAKQKLQEMKQQIGPLYTEAYTNKIIMTHPIYYI